MQLAEELANQTPVRLDVLLSLTPAAITSEQLVVPNPGESETGKQPVARSMSVGSIRDIPEIGNTEAEQRIIEMVAAGGEAALAPSPTRTMSPGESPGQQSKRKPETTISSESVIGEATIGARKREKPSEQVKCTQSKPSISEIMDVDENKTETLNEMNPNETQANEEVNNVLKDVIEMPRTKVPQRTNMNQDVPSVPLQTSSTGSDSKKPILKKCTKTKTTDLSETTHAPVAKPTPQTQQPIQNERRGNQQDDNVKPSPERRRSRILETAEKFQAAANVADKPKKIILSGVSVGNHKKEFERRASLTSTPSPNLVPTEKRNLMTNDSSEPLEPVASNSRESSLIDSAQNEDDSSKQLCAENAIKEVNSSGSDDRISKLTMSESKSSNLSLEEARRSMENSIALINQAKTESNSDVDQLCAKTENIVVTSDSDANSDRQKKLKAREIIGNAIPRLGMGIATSAKSYKPPINLFFRCNIRCTETSSTVRRKWSFSIWWFRAFFTTSWLGSQSEYIYST